MAPYIVFVFFAAHFVAMFNWSRLGPIIAIDGAFVLREMGLSAPFLLVGVLLLSSILDLFIGSASAKWSALAPVVVPMFMLLGISPEMTTAAYRMGDSYTNIMTPLMSYFPLILAFARRWDKDSAKWLSDPDYRVRIQTLFGLFAQAEGEPIKRVVHEFKRAGFDPMQVLDSPAAIEAAERMIAGAKAHNRKASGQARKVEPVTVDVED
jgi:hypothetical protein